MHPSRHWSTMSSCRKLFLAVLYWVGILTCPWSTPAKMQFSLFLPHQTLDASEQYLDLAFIPLHFSTCHESFIYLYEWMSGGGQINKGPRSGMKVCYSMPCSLSPTISDSLLFQQWGAFGKFYFYHCRDCIWPPSFRLCLTQWESPPWHSLWPHLWSSPFLGHLLNSSFSLPFISFLYHPWMRQCGKTFLQKHSTPLLDSEMTLSSPSSGSVA